MKEKLIDFETAKLLTHTSFNQKDCIDGYKIITGELSFDYMIDRINGKAIGAPTQSLLQKWLREVHNIQIVVIPFAEDSYDENSKCIYGSYVNEKQFYGFITREEGNCFKTWEDALEAGLLEALKKHLI